MGDEKPKAVKRAREDDYPKNCDVKKSKVMVNALQLMDINDDCLQQIFGYLDLEDLINIAEAEEQFISAATSEFSRRNRMKQKVFVGNDNMDIAAFFRHFGCIVSSLSIDFRNSGDVDIENLLQSHCINSLTNLDLAYIDQSDFKTIDKTFTNLEKLVISDGVVSQKLSQFETLCPNLISLEFTNVELSHPESFEANFPHLKHFNIYNYKESVPQSTLCQMLIQNPQLESLAVCCDYDITFLRLLSENMQHLNELKLCTPKNGFLNFGDEKICFENVKTFRLNSSQYPSALVSNMPFSFTNLQKLTLNGFNEFSGQLLNFIKKCKNLNTLNLVTCLEELNDLTYDDLKAIVDSLPKLVNLKFCPEAEAITVDEMIRFLSNSKSLQNVNLHFYTYGLTVEEMIPFFLSNSENSQEVINSSFRIAIEREWSVDVKYIEGDENMDDQNHVRFSLERKK